MVVGGDYNISKGHILSDENRLCSDVNYYHSDKLNSIVNSFSSLGLYQIINNNINKTGFLLDLIFNNTNN